MDKPTCSVSGCAARVHARAMCQAHYRRDRKHGTPEAHRPVLTRIPEGHSWCGNCSALKTVAEFPKASDRARGVASYCRECTTALRATKYRDTLYAQQARWMRANPGKSTEYSQRYADANPEKRKQLRARLVAAKPDLYAAIARAADANRRARERGAQGTASAAQIAARWEYYGGKCWVCRATAVETDHVKPLAKGGSHWPSNLRPICRDCNSWKRAKWPYPLEVARGRSTAPRESAPHPAAPVAVH